MNVTPAQNSPATAAPVPVAVDRTVPRGRPRALAIVAIAAGLFVAWQAADSILLIFAGLLFGVFLDSLVRLLQRVLPIGRVLALTVVCLLLLVLFGATLTWSGYVLSQQWGELARTLTQQMQWVGTQLEAIQFSLPEGTPGKGSDVQSLTQHFLPDPARLFGSARSAFNAALGVLGSSIVVVLVGIFFAASPETYRAGLVTLIPPTRRDRVGQVFDEIVNMLRWWLLGQLVTMIMIGISVWIVLSILGIPAALLLGTQAGLFNFIPYLGALVAAVPILLAAIPHGLVVFAWALAAYIVIQTIEGYIVTPLIQDRVVHLPPIATLTAIVMFGALFGAMGIAVATPAAACIRLALLRFYVEDYLERRHPP